MTTQDFNRMMELLEEQRRQVLSSPEASRKFLEELGVLDVVIALSQGANKRPIEGE